MEDTDAFLWDLATYPKGGPVGEEKKEAAKGEAKGGAKEEPEEASPGPRVPTKEEKAKFMEDETAGNNQAPAEGMVALIYNKASPKHRLAVQGDQLAASDGGEFCLDDYWHLQQISPSNPYYNDYGVK